MRIELSRRPPRAGPEPKVVASGSVRGEAPLDFYAFGETDSLLIADLPDATTAAAISMAVNESGAVQLKTTVLMTPEEMDQALKTSVGYRPPGT